MVQNYGKEMYKKCDAIEKLFLLLIRPTVFFTVLVFTVATFCNNNNLHLYSANLYMNIFGCALQYCYIKFMLKVTKA